MVHSSVGKLGVAWIGDSGRGINSGDRAGEVSGPGDALEEDGLDVALLGVSPTVNEARSRSSSVDLRRPVSLLLFGTEGG